MRDLRVATNVLKPDGTPAVGTRLAPGRAYDAIFDRKASFRGEVQILGEPYMTAYDPILDAKGEVLGILYVGIKKVEFLESALRHVLDDHLFHLEHCVARDAGQLFRGTKRDRASVESQHHDHEPPRTAATSWWKHPSLAAVMKSARSCWR